MPKKPIIIISVLCVISLVLGYLSGLKDDERLSNGDAETNSKKEPEFLKEGLVAYYPFNGNAKDESGNGRDGKVNMVPVDGNGNVEKLSNDRNGNPNSAYRFNGRRWIDIGNVIQNYANCTFSAWVNPRKANWEFLTIFSVGNEARPDKRGLSVHLGNNNGLGKFAATTHFGPEKGFNSVMPKYTVKVNDATIWHHVVAVTDGSLVRLYVNGAAYPIRNNHPSPIFPYKPTSSKMPALIGAMHNPDLPTLSTSRFFRGDIDDVRIYNRALSAEEVKALYEFDKAEKGD